MSKSATRKFAKRIAQQQKPEEVPMMYICDMYLAIKDVIPPPLSPEELRKVIPNAKRMR